MRACIKDVSGIAYYAGNERRTEWNSFRLLTSCSRLPAAGLAPLGDLCHPHGGWVDSFVKTYACRAADAGVVERFAYMR